MFTENRFMTSLAGLAVGPDSTVYARLLSSYGEASRHYHGTEHVAQCLVQLDRYRKLAQRPFEIEIAIWFHDAIYDTEKADNEEQSAQWAQEFLDAADVDASVTQRITDMILATKSHQVDGSDAALMLDIDLGILGAPDHAFEAYDAAIRREYHWVPEAQYRAGRAQVLKSFLERDLIYQTQVIRDQYEAQARKNLSAKIQELL